jgi:hypothetical protein
MLADSSSREGRLSSEEEKTMAITFHKHANNFTIIGNACINDPRLGFEALAIFTYLRSKPADWIVRPNEIAARFKSGRDRVRNAINELIAAGYIRKAQTRNPETGRLGPVEYVVHALPEDVPGADEVSIAPIAMSPSPETPSPETPSTVIRSLLSTDSLPRTDSNKTNTIPSLRSGGASAEEADASRALKKLDDDDRDGNKVDTKPVPAKPLPRDHQPKAPYLQSDEAAKREFRKLEELPFKTEWTGGITEHGAEFKPLSDRSDQAVSVYWKRLLCVPYRAAEIVKVAEHVLRRTPQHQWPSLAGFLARFEDYMAKAALVAELQS